MSNKEQSDRELFQRALERIELQPTGEIIHGVQVWSEDLQEYGHGTDPQAANLDFRESALETFDRLSESKEAELGPIMLEIQSNIRRMIEEERELNRSS